jgi:hypothetical protein
MASFTNFATWDSANYHVQQELNAGQYVSAETSLIASGPPEIGGVSAHQTVPASTVSTVYPIGLIENAGISQSKQLQKLFEIGSSRSYFIPGRTMGSLQLGRVFYYGPSLLRLFYAYYYNTANKINIGTKPPTATETLEDGSQFISPLARLLDTGTQKFHKVRMRPGADHFYANLASDLFNQPFGLAFYFRDSNYNLVGAFYLEQVYVQGHQFSMSSGSVLIMEGSSAQYDRMVPVRLRAG